MKRFVATLVLVLVVGALLTLAASTVFAGKKPTPPPPKGCLCPDVYAPVVCSNGQTYSNLCVAGCNGATGCVPTGDV